MELAILLIAVVGAGMLVAFGAIGWQIYVRPKLRRRYERKHFKNKSRR